MTNEEITLNLDIATDKLVTVKDYYERDRINQKFAEFMKHEITHLVKKQLTETLGLALIEAINSTVVNLTPDEAQPLEQICINDLDQSHRITRNLGINCLGQIMTSITWHCGNTAVNHLGINSEACISSRVKRLVVITSQALLPKGYIIGQLTDARLIAKI